MKRFRNLILRTLWWRLLAAMDIRGPAGEAEPEWDADDRANLLHFLRSATGRRLLTTLRYKEEILKSNACDGEQRRVDHARGRAVGYRECEASLIVLSAPPPPSEEIADTSVSGADELRDQLSHQ